MPGVRMGEALTDAEIAAQKAVFLAAFKAFRRAQDVKLVYDDLYTSDDRHAGKEYGFMHDNWYIDLEEIVRHISHEE